MSSGSRWRIARNRRVQGTASRGVPVFRDALLLAAGRREADVLES